MAFIAICPCCKAPKRIDDLRGRPVREIGCVRFLCRCGVKLWAVEPRPGENKAEATEIGPEF